jgi:glycosyltransferase involved in cell wall biosynthesis
MNQIDATRSVLAGSEPAPRLLVVSSYRRPCGIAQYVEFLEGPLRRLAGAQVEIAALPVDLLRAQTSFARRAAKAEFDKIVEQARRADVVNIQLEPGLFGQTPLAIWRRLGRLLHASRRVIITYHTVPPIDEQQVLGFRFYLSRSYLSALRARFVFNRLLASVRRHPQRFHHIVHAKRDAQRFALLGVPEDTITVLPLSFLDHEARASVDRAAARAQITERRKISEDAKIIGTFGFLSEYKGIEIAIRAIRHLPKDYHLIVVGGLHPEGIHNGTVEQPYVRRLLAEMKKGRIDPDAEPDDGRLDEAVRNAIMGVARRAGENVTERVHFCGAPSNDEFNQLLAACDTTVLAYAEVGQTSSGPAALALDMQVPLICSRTKCFRELDRFEPGILTFFEIGNHVELAQRIALGEPDRPEHRQARNRYVQKYNIEARAQAYVAAALRLAKVAA